MKRRSVGVSIIGTLFFPWGAKAILDVYSVWRSSLNLVNQGVLDSADPLIFETRMESIAVVALGLAWFISGIGVLMRMNWARLLALIIAGVSALGELIPFIRMVLNSWIPSWVYQYHTAMYGRSSFFSGWFGKELLRWLGISALNCLVLAWYGLIIWYFLRPSVKAQFVKETPTRS